MSEMIERVARALHASLGYETEWPTPECTQCMDAARAAIEAMREPTRDIDYDHAILVWEAMIDAALQADGPAGNRGQVGWMGGEFDR